ncbi:hypothetical protein BDV95DRAFT_589918 [Massariosphaeria phaeospora]|uniref:Uncharacterized protein n=1 Tax=Massariosphaeria phaeospora TaxID=100035 RepID=A0A7C8MCZ1_9PLEO|nr:hypothetical protein BDV95DRAFT_589918 [Massariosphaeria phaeospora]
MCRVEKRVYVGSDGRRQEFEEPFPCDRARGSRLCSQVKRRTTEYFPKAPPVRDDTSSPASNNPPTPTGTGSYLIQERRPSGNVERRPSTREGPRVVKPPHIIIELGRKDRSKKYPAVSVYPKISSKRTSLGASSDVAVESSGSDASYTYRTGLPEAPVVSADPLRQSHGYTTRPAVPQGHRHTSSASSFTPSSQPPSLYATSDPDSPSTRRPARYPPTIIHNPLPGGAPPSPTMSRAPATGPSNSYHITLASPHSSHREQVAPDGLTPLDYSDFVNNNVSSHASSSRAPAPEITDRGADRERMRQQKAYERKRQEQADRRFAEELAKEETEVKQVRFELDRADTRAEQRAEQKLAESEKRRAEVREKERQRKQEDMARKEWEVREAEAKLKQGSRPPPTTTTRRHSRRPSVSQADAEERKRLLLETEAQMAREREAAERRERDEKAALLRQQQQTTQYYNPRAGDSGAGFSRRNSVSGRRGSVSGPPPPLTGLGRTNSTRRVSISQPNPPALTAAFSQQQYHTRPPSSHHQNPPPPFFSPSSQQDYPSARHAPHPSDNPFAQPGLRSSTDTNPFAARTSQENPFAQPHAAWDTRNMHDALPTTLMSSAHSRQVSDEGRYRTLQGRGEDVISRAARQATRSMQMAVGYEDDYQESGSEVEDGYAARGARRRRG